MVRDPRRLGPERVRVQIALGDLADRAVVSSAVSHTIFAPSMAYAPGDPFLRLLERLSLLPAMPLSGGGRAAFQPIWAEDVADCVMAALPSGPRGAEAEGARFEL